MKSITQLWVTNEMKTLIDKASKMCGSDAALAKRMGVAQSVISDMRHRGRTVTPETAAELADIAGEDAREAAIAAILERAKGTRREGVLREVLGKAVAVGVAGMCLISYSADSISSTVTQKKSDVFVNTLYIVEDAIKALKQLRLRVLDWYAAGLPRLHGV